MLRAVAAGGTLASTRATEAFTTSASSDVFDEALELLKGRGPEYGGGLANHGPMAAEALVALGRTDAVVPWVSAYRRRLDVLPAAWKPLTEADWRAALGDPRHAGDWARFFEAQLAEKPWPEVVDTWVARLAPGLVAAATHGTIRTGHAVRALAARDTPTRRQELAAGLGYWATHFQTLPSAAGGVTANLTAREALPRVPVVPPDQQGHGFITDRLRPLANLPAFASIIDLLDTSGDPSRVLSDITRAFAGVYLTNAGTATIAFVHTVTGPSSLRLMLPYLSPATAHSALRYAWQAAAGMYAAHARPDGPAPADLPNVLDVEGLTAEAVDAGDEHAIKFTEACLREHKVAPAPEFLAAARDACPRLG